MDGRGQAAGVAAVGVGDEDAVDFRLARAGVLIEIDLLAVGLVVGVDHGDQSFKLTEFEDCAKHYPGVVFISGSARNGILRQSRESPT